MNSKIPTENLILTAEQLLSSILSCVNDKNKFFENLQNFDIWFNENSKLLSETENVSNELKIRIRKILFKITTIEKVINTNLSLGKDMHNFLIEKNS